jgi:hypothetical protein
VTATRDALLDLLELAKPGGAARLEEVARRWGPLGLWDEEGGLGLDEGTLSEPVRGWIRTAKTMRAILELAAAVRKPRSEDRSEARSPVRAEYDYRAELTRGIDPRVAARLAPPPAHDLSVEALGPYLASELDHLVDRARIQPHVTWDAGTSRLRLEWHFGHLYAAAVHYLVLGAAKVEALAFCEDCHDPFFLQRPWMRFCPSCGERVAARLRQRRRRQKPTAQSPRRRAPRRGLRRASATANSGSLPTIREVPDV